MTSPTLAPAPGVAARWPVLAGVWGVYFSFGVIIASMAPLLAEIRADIDANNAVIGAILGSWPLAYILCAVPCGILLDRLGARRMLVLATVIMASSALLRCVAETPFQLFLAVAVFGAGGPMISVGAPLVIARLYEGKARATAMGLYVTGPYLGGLVALGLTNAVVLPLVGGNWRGVMAAYAGLVLASGFFWLMVSRGRAADLGAAGDGKKYNLRAFAEILSVPAVRVILIMAVGVFFINHGFNNWMPEILRSYGFTAVSAGVWAALPPAIGILGVLFIPRLATPERRLLVMATLFGAVLLASLLLQSQQPILLATGLMLQGLARGSMMTVAIMLLMETPGVPEERLGLAGGLFFTSAEIGGVLGPVSFGTLAHWTGGFSVPLFGVTLIASGLLILLAVMRRGPGA
ncbi:MFS transporter [Lutimaribacter sp. EGI FJ00015]|uniref:MFS transporter n=1 Tax=Lutimaribacter degradans TaxID=2945989 RepID=A0ACC5ZXP6_9RHOB|nr:MFS transporter [Lutimaribacter sp. EGI FJ00013]MCO0614146.1 MFS transporter [Lutimaribacter sp. EGI FJ00015]MCO0636123.1 MFS transporter [Lutimaribacter sp. EGI FJ00014]